MAPVFTQRDGIDTTPEPQRRQRTRTPSCGNKKRCSAGPRARRQQAAQTARQVTERQVAAAEVLRGAVETTELDGVQCLANLGLVDIAYLRRGSTSRTQSKHGWRLEISVKWCLQ